MVGDWKTCTGRDVSKKVTANFNTLLYMLPGKTEKKYGFTLLEVIIGMCILVILLFAAYNIFFAEVRSIRKALEHVSVNENARLFLARFGNDIRNANWLDFPTPTVREGVAKLLPAMDKVCAFTSQVFDFSIKPPDSKFIKTIKIEWKMKKAIDGTWDLYRDVESEVPASTGGQSPYKASRKVCGGVKEIFVYSEIKKPVKFSSFPGLPLKNLLVYEPYEIDGTGPYLVHVRITFVRQTGSTKKFDDPFPFTLRTCFAVRGKLNCVNP